MASANRSLPPLCWQLELRDGAAAVDDRALRLCLVVAGAAGVKIVAFKVDLRDNIPRAEHQHLVPQVQRLGPVE